MKHSILVILAAFFMVGSQLKAQDDINTITTAVPFLIIAGDARAAGLGEQGVATAPDLYGMQWNPSKLAFIEDEHNIGLNYSPYLRELVNDIGILNFGYAKRLNEQSAFGASLRYFSLGEIQLTDGSGNNTGTEKPNEFALDVTYALKLSARFSMAVSGRYIRSDLRFQNEMADATAASSFGVDISGYYQSEEIVYGDFDGRWRGGFNFSNIGPKISYDDTDNNENFIPTNMKLGGGFDFILDPYNTIFVGLEFNKLLVPTPPIRDAEGNVIAGEDDDVSFFSGIFQSFGDAPGGFSEELKEFTWSLGSEYVYNEVFSLRAGYFNESDIKGNRKFATLGAGFEFSSIDIDLSYLFTTSATTSNPLENTLRFGLTFHFGDTYEEY